ncbi:MAG: RNAase [Alphaproteobacteria bacterium CG1_02_46_17]|nr:MAG: RNAase [Alphaproteobacteria bacterium CG1_02_46_17]
MHPIFEKNLFLVKEQIGIFKAANNFDIFDPETGSKVLECREPNLGLFTKLLRFTDFKRMTPFEIVISTPEGRKLLTVKRGISILHSNVEVLDENNRKIGSFNQKIFSIGGRFEVLSPAGQLLCMLQGNLIGWSFKFLRKEQQIAEVSKKWAGIGKEFFTSSDNYVLQIDGNVESADPLRTLIFAAVMCIDMCLKE